jgi:hypothetical protein
MPDLICTWCDLPFTAARRDALTCSKPCRQARHRAGFLQDDTTGTGPARRLAYADPPYPGSARLYNKEADWRGEIDLPHLIATLTNYDGWALSTSARALPTVLSLCLCGGHKVRVAAWIRHARPHATAPILNAWEPLIYRPCRAGPGTVPARQTLDVLIGPTPRRRSTLPRAIIGMKPPQFALWMFALIAGSRRDTFDDLYPGSGIITNAWLHFSGQRPVNHKPARGWDDTTRSTSDTSRPAAAGDDRP